MANLIVKSEIKEQVAELSISGEVYEKLNEVVKELIQKASARAVANKRKTLCARDF